MDNYLLDIFTRRQVLLERLKASYSKNYSSKYIFQLNKAITEALDQLPDGDPISVSSNIAQIEQVISSLRAKQRKIYDSFIAETQIQNEEFVGESIYFETEALKNVTEYAIIRQIDRSLAWHLANAAPIRATGNLLKPFYRDWTDKEITAVEGIVRNGYWAGATKSELLRSIRGSAAAKYTDGYLGRNDRGATTIIRTATQHLSNTTRAAVWQENEDILDGYKIVATLDGRTSTICRSMDGREFEIGKGPLPPFHAGCRTTTVPVIKKKYRVLPEGTRSSLDGYIAGDTTYYEWLLTQPASFQDTAIGATRGKLLRDGGLTANEFGRLNLGRNFEPLTLEQMRRLNPQAFERAKI